MKINQYPIIASVSDGDFFLIQTASDGAYKGITASALQAYFSNPTSTPTEGTTGSDLNYSSVKFLSHFEVNPFIDVKGHSIADNNAVLLTTSDKYFGVASAQFSGTSDSYLSVNDSANDFSLTGDFTIENFINFSSLGQTNYFHPIIEIGNPLSTGLRVGYDNYNPPGIQLIIAGNTIEPSWNPVINTWYYFAICRASGVVSININGSPLAGTLNNNASIISGGSMLIGGSSLSSQQRLIGKIDEMRISSIARNVSVTPLSAFPTQ